MKIYMILNAESSNLILNTQKVQKSHWEFYFLKCISLMVIDTDLAIAKFIGF
jgi:hypothetical protein